MGVRIQVRVNSRVRASDTQGAGERWGGANAEGRIHHMNMVRVGVRARVRRIRVGPRRSESWPPGGPFQYTAQYISTP